MYVGKTKATTKLICVFVFAYANIGFFVTQLMIKLNKMNLSKARKIDCNIIVIA